MQRWGKRKKHREGRGITHGNRLFPRKCKNHTCILSSHYSIKTMLEPNADRQIVQQGTIQSRSTTIIGNIDYERLWNGETVPKEFFCPICSCLLWQPRSCGACQNLFCEACILKWLQVKQSCPYGCARYEDKRCSPQIRCLLSNVWIRCQSARFGCTEVLSYDTLEEHQTKKCPYSSARCQYCEHLLLVSVIKDHEHECGQRLVNCTRCDRLIPMFLLEKHQLSCFIMDPQQHYLQTMLNLQNLTQLAHPFQPNMPAQETAVQLADFFNLTPEERYIQEQYRELTWWHRIGRVVRLMFNKPFDTPHILLTVWKSGFGCMLGYIIGCVLAVFVYWFRNLCTGFLLIIVLTGLLHSVAPWLLDSIDDKSIMIILTILFIIAGSSSIQHNAHHLNKTPKLAFTLLDYIAHIFLWKVTLLFFRFYFHWIPAYVTATFVSGISIFVVEIARLSTSQQLPT